MSGIEIPHRSRTTSSHEIGRKAASFQNCPQLSRKFVARRISEGETGRLKEQLKCQACGKGYKHVSSLAKHLWEHTPEWNVTSKLLISKHQQVQLLEAASILVSMNEEDDCLEKGESDALEDSSDKGDDESDDKKESDSEFKYKSNQKSGSRHDKHEDYTHEASPDIQLKNTADKGSENQNHMLSPSSMKNECAVDDVVPAKEIPILNAKPIAKTSLRHRARRTSTTSAYTHSYGSLSKLDDLAQLASPLPDSILTKDSSHYPPRRRRQSTLIASSIPRDTYVSLDDDGLQEPQDPHDQESHDADKHSSDNENDSYNAKDKEGMGDVFGTMEV